MYSLHETKYKYVHFKKLLFRAAGRPVGRAAGRTVGRPDGFIETNAISVIFQWKFPT